MPPVSYIEFNGWSWLDDFGQLQTEAVPGDQLLQKDITIYFRTPGGLMQHCRAQGQAAILRYQQLDLAHKKLLLQHQELLLGQAAYVLDQTGGMAPK